MRRGLSRQTRVIWFVAWSAFGGLALALPFASAGFGHGDYLLAKVLFPLPMLIGMYSNTLAGIPVALAVIEYPGIGALGLVVNRHRSLVRIAAAYLVISTICVLLVLSRPAEQFGP